MTHIGQPYTSGDWLVKEGNEEAFIAQWTAVADWCLEHSLGVRSFHLIRDRGDPRHFISFGEWQNFDAVSVARSRPGFLERFHECQVLCERFSGSDYTVVLAAPEG